MKIALGMRLRGLLSILTLALGGPAFAQAQATQCDIVVQSQAGGVIEVITSGKLTEAPQIVWRPTPSNGRIEMLVFFPGDALAGLGEPSGLLMRFPLAASDPPDGVTLAIQSRNGRQWRFKGQTRDRDAESGYVAFDQTLVYGRARLGAIADGQGITISAERYDRSLGLTVFGLENLRARDVLLVQARRKLEAADPAKCKRG